MAEILWAFVWNCRLSTSYRNTQNPAAEHRMHRDAAIFSQTQLLAAIDIP
jgi:hypothetical protein